MFYFSSYEYDYYVQHWLLLCRYEAQDLSCSHDVLEKLDSEGHLVENGNHNYQFEEMWLSPGKNNTIK